MESEEPGPSGHSSYNCPISNQFTTTNTLSGSSRKLKRMFSFLGQIVYLGLMSATLLATMISMFTPGWRTLMRQNQLDSADSINSGMFMCENLDIGTCFSRHSTVDVIITVCLVFALLSELAAFGWGIASLFTCCFRKLRRTLFYPLPGLAGLISLFLFIVILLFSLKEAGKVEFDIKATVGQAAKISYSFFICCIAFFFALCSIGAGVWTAFFIEHDY